jgi:hypothetical protein
MRKYTLKSLKEKNKKMKEFNQGEKVLVRNETRKNKNVDEYEKEATILERLYGDVYKVRIGDSLLTNRHASQLKSLKEGEVGNLPNITNDWNNQNKQDVLRIGD